MYLKPRSSVKWKTIRRLPLLLSVLWLRLRLQWQDNPGYVAATVAGTIGLLLTASLLIQTGLGLLADDPEVDESAIESQEFAEDDLGEPGSEQRALIARLRAQDREAAPLNAALDDADADETTDPFGDPLPQAKTTTEQMEDEENTDAAEPDVPARIALKASPVIRRHVLSEADDSEIVSQVPERPVFEPARLKITDQADLNDDTDSVGPAVSLESETASEEEAPPPYRRQATPAPRRDQWQPTADLSSNESSFRDDDAIPEQPSRYQPAAASIAARRSSPAETVVVPARIAQPSAPARPREPKVADSGFPVTVALAGPPSASLDQPCDLEVRLTNNGSKIVRNLVISLELPSGLSHPVAQSLEQVVEALPPGKTHRAVVHLRPRQTGTMVVQAEVAAADNANVKLRTKVLVGKQIGTTATAAACLPCLE